MSDWLIRWRAHREEQKRSDAWAKATASTDTEVTCMLSWEEVSRLREIPEKEPTLTLRR